MFTKLFVSWWRNKHYIRWVCARVWVCACVCMPMDVYECGCKGAGAFAHVWPHLSSIESACSILYYHLWRLWLHHIFRHYLVKRTIFGKKLLNRKCVFWCSLQLLFETFLTVRLIQRDIVINVKTNSCEVPVTLVGFKWKLDFFKKNVKYRISSKSFQWERSCFLRTDRQTRRS